MVKPSNKILRYARMSVLACWALSAMLAAAGAGEGNAGDKGKSVPVTVVEVVEQDVPIQVRAFGRVEPNATVAVKPQATGQILKVHCQDGQPVKVGDILFTIDARPYEAAFKQAEATLAQHHAQAKNAARDAERNAQLLKSGTGSRKDAEDSQATYDALASQVRADEAALESAKIELDYCVIRAPLAGRISISQIDAGNLVKPSDTAALVTINQTIPARVVFAVSESDLPRIRKRAADGKIKVQAFPPKSDKKAEGEATALDNAVNAETGTIRIKAMFPNTDECLWPGQFVHVVMTLGVEEKALTLPAKAVASSQQGGFVYVATPDNKAEMRLVEVERQHEELMVIKSGLGAGEKVVSEGQLRLTPGAAIKIRSSSSGDSGASQKKPEIRNGI